MYKSNSLTLTEKKNRVSYLIMLSHTYVDGQFAAVH